ncbi:MAG: glycosyltransferase family 2 protein, partial [Deltaproteobacteria bacterium]|nr:glycosyltransferase family 2 protein [Deltaproteobacteria bacterium]
MPSVSVVIPTKNGEATIDAVLKTIFQQPVPEDPEIIIVDSGSQDQTLTIAKQYPVSIIRIHPQDFNHGETRNHGIRASKGEFIVLITQDAEPANEHWLSNILKGFADPQVAGVYARQIPREDADVITRRRLNSWITCEKKRHRAKIVDRSHYEKL